MLKVTKKDGESTDKLMKRFSSHIKSRRLMQKFRAARYFKQKPTKRLTRQAAVSREKYRAENKKREFLT